MSRRLILLAGVTIALVVLASAVAVIVSNASYTTSSVTDVRASTDTAGNWLHLYSQETDPDGLTGYALRRVEAPPAPPCASASDAALSVDMGGFPDTNTTFTFDRTFTIETPATFPDVAVTAVTATISLLDDPDTGERPVRSARFTTLSGGGASTSVTLGPGEKRQCNIQVRARKRYQTGSTYYPVVRIALTFTGGAMPSGYYVYDVPVAVTDAGF